MANKTPTLSDCSVASLKLTSWAAGGLWRGRFRMWPDARDWSWLRREEGIGEMMLGSLPNFPCQRLGGRWFLVLVVACKPACSYCLSCFLYRYSIALRGHPYTARCMTVKEILIYIRQCLLKCSNGFCPHPLIPITRNLETPIFFRQSVL